jgi:hypothetical protein
MEKTDMIYPLFPFGEINKGSRIILYAAGNIGQNYYRQIVDTGFCDIVLWVDRSPAESRIKEPSTIRDLRDDEYDLVVIAVHDHEMAEQIGKYLEEFNVSESKIFFKPPLYIAGCKVDEVERSSLKLSDYLSGEAKIQDALIEYFCRADGSIVFFKSLMMKSNNQPKMTVKCVLELKKSLRKS